MTTHPQSTNGQPEQPQSKGDRTIIGALYIMPGTGEVTRTRPTRDELESLREH